MARKVTKMVLVSCVAFCLIFLGALATLWWFVNTGRLQTLIERRSEEASGLRVQMKSLHLSWPIGVIMEELAVAAPGHENTPLLTCPRLRIKTSFGTLLRRRLLSVELLSPRINLMKDERGSHNVPSLTPGGKTDNLFSIGTVKLVNGEFTLDLPEAKAKLSGVSASIAEPIIPADGKKVFGLNIDGGNVYIGRENQRQIPIALTRVESKLSLRSKPSKTKFEADIQALITTEIPHLLLPPDIPVNLSFAADYFPRRDSLENGVFALRMPMISDLSVYGSVAGVTGGAPSPNLRLTFEVPEIANSLEYIEPLRRPMYEGLKMGGSLRVNGELKGSFGNPKLSLEAETRDGRFEWKGFVLDGLEAQMPARISTEDFFIGPGRFKANKTLIPVSETRVEVTRLNGLLSADTSRFSVSELSMKLGDAGELSLDGAYEFDSGLFLASARMVDASVEDMLGIVPSTVYKLPDNVTAAGALGFDCDFEGKFASALEKLDIRCDVSLEQGELFSGEFVGAAGVNAKLSGNIASQSPKKLWRFDVKGDVANFEVLVDTFYKSFSKSDFPFSFSGEYAVEPKLIRDAGASLDLGRMGKITARGTAQFASKPEIVMRLKTDRIDLGEVFEEVAQQVLSEMSPLFREAELDGVVSGSLAVRLRSDHWKADGTLDVTDGRVALEKDALSIDSFSARLPFDVCSPQEKQGEPVMFTDEDYGKITVGKLDIGPVHAPSLALDFALKKNALRVKGPVSVNVFEGKLNIGEIRGDNVLGRSAGLTTSLSAENINLGQLSEMLGLPEIPGTLNAQFPDIALTADSLTADGAARVTAFGGTVDIRSVGVEQLFSRVRAFRSDLEFKDIELSALTNVLDFGTISGIMEGTLKGLEISQGQAAAFVADFETVRRKGVRQRINFDAVRNITILGTGQGFQAGVGRGLASFFDEFGYDKIGFYCTLKNDNFGMKGKVVQGDTEYFVKGVAFGPSINVINRNPGQTVSFKSMLERINRIKQEPSK